MVPSRRNAQPDYATLAALRHALRRFLRFSQAAAQRAGIPPQQHQALLALKGAAGRDHLTVGELAEHLHLRHHSAVGLVDRLARAGWVRRSSSAADRRRVEVRVTARGEALLRKLSAVHLEELRALGPELRRLLTLVSRP